MQYAECAVPKCQALVTVGEKVGNRQSAGEVALLSGGQCCEHSAHCTVLHCSLVDSAYLPLGVQQFNAIHHTPILIEIEASINIIHISVEDMMG